MAVAVCICFLIFFIGKETLGLPRAAKKLSIHVYNVETSAKINSKIIEKKTLISDLKLESVRGIAKVTPLRYQQS